MKRYAVIVGCLSGCVAVATTGVFLKYGLNAETGTAVLVSMFGLYIAVSVIMDRVAYLGVGAFRPPYSIVGKVLAASLGIAIVGLSVSSIVRG
jgi:hypothetical protein